jgi:hypothetical protein
MVDKEQRREEVTLLFSLMKIFIKSSSISGNNNLCDAHNRFMSSEWQANDHASVCDRRNTGDATTALIIGSGSQYRANDGCETGKAQYKLFHNAVFKDELNM